MSKERELLKKILATGWLNNTISCEVEKLLAQPEQEPVAWRTYRVVTDDWQYHIFPYGLDLTCQPLYLAPQKREQPEQDDQTPSSTKLQDRIKDYLSMGGLFNPELVNHDAVRDLILDARAELDLKREPLSDEEIMILGGQNLCNEANSFKPFGFARAIEKTHGIGVDDETV